MSQNESKKKVSKPDPTLGMNFKEKIDFWFNDVKTPMGKLFDLVPVSLIVVLCITYVMTTFDIPEATKEIILWIEHIIVGIFVVEYVLRFWVAKQKIRHFFNIYSLIDLVSILPLFFTFTNLQFLRIFRVFRIFRILRLLRFLKDDNLLLGSLRPDNLIIARIIFTIFSIVFVNSGLIYFEEANVNPNFKNFFDAIYFSIVTLTTVGYGDITPVTEGGRIITLLMIVSGVVFLPWQIGSLIRKFVSTIDKQDVVCKDCGLKFHDKDAIHCKHCGAMLYNERVSDED